MISMAPVTSSTPVALLGLGIIGSGIARHLRSAGWNVLVWNRTPKADLPNDLSGPADAARRAKVICLYLKDREACLQVLSALKGDLTPEHVIINHSTIDVATVRQLAAECAAVGCTYWDAPFTGSRTPAAQGQLVYYVSGPPEKLPVVRPLLEASSKSILEFGTEPGQATTVKLVTNLVSAITVQALSEALAIVKSNGMTAEDLLRALSLNVCGSILANNKIPCMDKGDFSTNFSMDNMRKDSVYVRELARSEGLATPAIDLVSSLMAELCSKGHAEEDFGALSRNFPTTPGAL